MLSFWKRLFGSSPATRAGSPANSAPQENQWTRGGELHFSQLTDSVRDYAIIFLNPDGLITTWNAGAERIKGYRAEQILGRHFSTFYTKEAVAAGWPEHELKVASQTRRFEDEGWRVRQDGSRFWANVVITAIYDQDRLQGFLKITRDLTDRRQAEEKLRLSEERFRLLVENVQDYAIFLLDPTGRVATWNAGAQRIKGYTQNEIIGEHFSRFYPQEAIDRRWPEEELRRALADGRFEDEGWRIRKDGTQFWANVVLTALRDETGTLHGFSKVTRDLTERHKAEEQTRLLLQEEAARQAAEASQREAQLARDEERRQRSQWQVTLSSIGDAVIVADARGAITFMNPVAIQLTGWTLADALNQPLETVFQIINEQTRRPVDNPAQKVIQTGAIVGLANHTLLVSRNGEQIPIDDSAAPIRTEDHSIAGVVLVFRDVTEPRRAAEAQQHLAAIVESTDDAIIGHDLEGRIVSWNQGARRLYGYTDAEMLGQPLTRLIPQDHPNDLHDNLRRIRQGETIQNLETERLRKDGGRVHVSLTISPVRDAAGEIIGASKIARDITARREEDQRKNEFLALLAHELRNPLAAVRSGIEVLRLGGEDRSTSEEVLTIMERQVLHLVRMVDDLLDVSRITRGKLDLRLEPLTLDSVVSAALETCDSLLKSNNQKLHVTMPPEPVPLLADRTRLAQAISNLIVNASKFSDPGSSIVLLAEVRGEQVHLHVQDTGVGIAPHMLSRIFEMFLQADQSLEKSRTGLGIGLSVVRRLVEMHGGSVEARSAGLGQGSDFIIRLPVAAPHARQTHAAHSSPHVPAARKFRILVVDDNLDAATTLAQMLKIMGHEVHVAGDGQAALSVGQTAHPELVVLDIGMPVMNGYETCRLMRQQPWGGKAKIVALTGWGQEEDRLKTESAGFDEHLVKPVEPDAVRQMIAALGKEAGVEAP